MEQSISNNNKSIAYAIYMMMGSYFKKAVCKSEILRKNLLLVYAETKRDNQIRLEERCENYIENFIVPNVPDEIFQDMVEVYFVNNKETNTLEVIFVGFDWKITMWGDSSAKGVRFDYIFSEQ